MKTKYGSVAPAMILVSFSVLLLLFINNCGSVVEEPDSYEADLMEQARIFFRPMPENAFPEGQEASKELIDLGKMLYYEPRLSKSGLISCHTCHNLGLAGVDNLPVSLGHKWQTGPRNAPTVLNAALHSSQFHDGREPDVESQALMPILDAVEMASSEEHVMAVINSIPRYVELFHISFPNDDEPVTFKNTGIAIGSFERTLLTYSRLDDFIKGDTEALEKDELKGLEIFINLGCVACHIRETLGGQTFARFITPREQSGEAEPDPGRFNFTGREDDRHFFKVPSLLNVAETFPYFHDGSEWSLANAIREVGMSQLGVELSGEEVEYLVYFMHALSGEASPYARELPVLPRSEPGTPKPVFD